MKAGRLAAILLAFAACGDPTDPGLVEGECAIADAAEAPDYLGRIDCSADFVALASEPLAAGIPGARSVKVVIDQLDGDALYFQHSTRFPIHHDFASATLSGGGRPVVGSLADFNQTEYFAPDRRFLLGAVTHYEGPDVWALEIAPYDTASVEMITKLHDAVAGATWFGPALAVHPTSEAVAAVAAGLPARIRVITTDEIYAGIDYQPLTTATSMGQLRFIDAADVAGTYLSYREIVVLDTAPNDISVVSGIITEEFQTPLSHINVLSRNRGTPNMGLKGARTNPELLALEGRWVQLEVGATAWSVTEVTQADADAWWEGHRPEPIVLPPVDVSVTDLRDIEDVVPEGETSLRDAIKTAVNAFGGKAAQYSILAKTEGVPVRQAFAIPAHYFVEFMEANGLYERLAELRADPDFQGSAQVRDARLAEFRAAMESAPIDAAFQDLLRAKLAADYPGQTMRFRSSTNSEDLEAFPCAGCYESHTGDPADWLDVLDAIRTTWSSAFLFRTYEEREYYGVAHESVAMALLVHHNFPDEEANGVAVTANPFDASGLQPAFYINVQFGGDVEVVHPPAGTTSDQVLYLYDEPGQPLIYLSHSNVIAAGETVLNATQYHDLGAALAAIHERFSEAYGPAAGNHGWYAMDVEFKFDGEPGETPQLYVKQARPYPAGAE